MHMTPINILNSDIHIRIAVHTCTSHHIHDIHTYINIPHTTRNMYYITTYTQTQ